MVYERPHRPLELRIRRGYALVLWSLVPHPDRDRPIVRDCRSMDRSTYDDLHDRPCRHRGARSDRAACGWPLGRLGRRQPVPDGYLYGSIFFTPIDVPFLFAM